MFISHYELEIYKKFCHFSFSIFFSINSPPRLYEKMHNILISDFSLSTNQAWLGSKLELPLCRTVIQWILFPVVVNIFYAILNLEILNIANSFLLFKYDSLELHSDTWCYGNAFAYFVVHSRYIMSKHANLAISIVPKPKHAGLTFCLEVQIHTLAKHV